MAAVETALDAVARAARRRPGRGRARHRPDREQQHDQRAQARSRSTAATTRATSRSSRSAAAAACTRSRSRPSSGSARSSIPRAADVFSAWGMLMSDLRRDYFVTRLIDADAARTPTGSTRCSARSTADGAGRSSRREGDRGRSRCASVRYGNLRYENQEHSVEIAAPRRRRSTRRRSRRSRTRSTSAYEREYTYRLDAPVEFVGVHLVAIAEVGKLAPAPLPVDRAHARRTRSKGHAHVDYATEGVHEADIYDGELLEPGVSFEGPAIVETKRQHDGRPSGQRGRGRRLRQPRHPRTSTATMTTTRSSRRPTRSRSRSSRARCRRSATRCSPRSARRR